MFSVLIIAVGKLKNTNFRDVCDEYEKRVSPFAKLEITEVDAEASFSDADKERVQKKEEERIVKILEKNKGNIFLLSEDGKQYNSLELAELVTRTSEKNIFIIGGSFGFSPEFKNKYKAYSLSLLTFPHELARVVLVEQLYRAVTINQKENKYHK
ncbi:MAG: 23S rRNA (pseudouridine1915-N3)-methyltransferase [Parcubacteria group bacterium LiPW_41]|nr:MAG: 23S rRNA (pseudouridine1915-N3)-methyltransferase [Parcubacteria group bacterium LiPW_41]